MSNAVSTVTPRGASTGVRRNLVFSSWENLFSSAMVGAGETLIPAFALAAGASQMTAALMAALPFLIGSVLQLQVPKLLGVLRSYRKLVVILCLIQSASLFALAACAFSAKETPEIVLYVITTVYWACGLASGPAWSSWMTTIVPPRIRPKYFARRSHVGQLGLLSGLLLSGLSLHMAEKIGFELVAFGAIFTASGIFRLVSTACMRSQSEAPGASTSQRQLPLLEVVARFREGREGRLMKFLLLFTLATNLAGPYFNPFMLKHLNLDYGAYVFMLSTLYAAKISVLAALGGRLRGIRPASLMKAGLIGVSFVPVLWIFSSNYVYLLLTQVIAGLAWGIFDLGVTLALFSVVRDDERTSVLSAYNFFSALMVVGGTLLGGRLLAIFGETTTAFLCLFVVSSVMRLYCVAKFDGVGALLPESALEPGTRLFSGFRLASMARRRVLDVHFSSQTTPGSDVAHESANSPAAGKPPAA